MYGLKPETLARVRTRCIAFEAAEARRTRLLASAKVVVAAARLSHREVSAQQQGAGAGHDARQPQRVPKPQRA
jgi:hypothetical protein